MFAAGGILSLIFKAFFDAFGHALVEIFGGLQRDKANRDAGASGEKATIAEKSLEQQTEIRDAEDRARARTDTELADRLRQYRAPSARPIG